MWMTPAATVNIATLMRQPAARLGTTVRVAPDGTATQLLVADTQNDVAAVCPLQSPLWHSSFDMQFAQSDSEPVAEGFTRTQGSLGTLEAQVVKPRTVSVLGLPQTPLRQSVFKLHFWQSRTLPLPSPL